MIKPFLFFNAILILLLASCQKENECLKMRYEISGDQTSIDLIDFRVASESYFKPDVQRFHENKSIPFSEEVEICVDHFDYNLRCYTTDSNLNISFKVYANGTLIDEEVGKIGATRNFYEFGGGF